MHNKIFSELQFQSDQNTERFQCRDDPRGGIIPLVFPLKSSSATSNANHLEPRMCLACRSHRPQDTNLQYLFVDRWLVHPLGSDSGQTVLGPEGWAPEPMGPPKGGARMVKARLLVARRVEGPKFRAFFPSRHSFLSFLPLLKVLSWNCERGSRRNRTNCKFGLLWGHFVRSTGSVFSSSTAVPVKDTTQKHVINTSFDTHTHHGSLHRHRQPQRPRPDVGSVAFLRLPKRNWIRCFACFQRPRKARFVEVDWQQR